MVSLAQTTALPTFPPHDQHPLTISPWNMIGIVPSCVLALGRRCWRGRRLGGGGGRRSTTPTPRRLLQQVHLLYVNFAKMMSVAQLDLANKVGCCLSTLYSVEIYVTASFLIQAVLYTHLAA